MGGGDPPSNSYDTPRPRCRLFSSKFNNGIQQQQQQQHRRRRRRLLSGIGKL